MARGKGTREAFLQIPAPLLRQKPQALCHYLGKSPLFYYRCRIWSGRVCHRLQQLKKESEPGRLCHLQYLSLMIRKVICINSLIIVLMAGFFLVYPAVRAALNIRDPALSEPGIPKATWRLFRSLTPRYAAWATKRVAEGRAETLSTEDISG